MKRFIFLLLGLACILPVKSVAQAVPLPLEVVINEIHYNPLGSDDLEFLELYNVSNKTFDLKDFRFKDDTATIRTIIGTSTLLLPGAYVVLAKDGTLFPTAYPTAKAIIPPSWPALNNDSEVVTLLYGNTTIDQVSYRSSWGGTDVSLERVDPNSASNNAANWGSCTDPAKATPGKQNSIYKPDVEPPKVLIARQTTNTTVQVVFNEPLLATSVQPTGFRLGGVAPNAAALSTDGLSVILTFTNVTTGMLTITGVQDLAKNAVSTLQVVLARFPQPGELLINEIMFDPLADTKDSIPDQTEYFELVNISTAALDITNLFWTNAPDENGKADTIRVSVGNRSVAPGGYVVISSEPGFNAAAPASTSKLAKAFGGIFFDDPSITFVPIDRTSLSLTNSGETIRLHRSDKTVLDEVSYLPEWHNPNMLVTKGVALERISPSTTSNKANNWTSSAGLQGGTPGKQNSVYTAGEVPQNSGKISVRPSPFSPDQDGKDDVAAISYKLITTTSLIRVRIYDSTGRLVRTLEEAVLGTQEGTLFWDGLDEAGQSLRVGIYIVLLESVDRSTGTTEAYKAPVVLARKF
ncbi:MAG TPA: lamin tail domain-containing protein [Rhodothermales bacterium]|nr:lamin tail domain-containing protein [Rhodothermales bacterium]HRR07629.1 lamin tail domain-containing protein [Rhodothermales bacterium]